MSTPSRPAVAPEVHAASQVRFVLVQPEHPGNVGATCRALKNMGFEDLRLVGPASLAQHPDAVRLAHGAEEMLGRIRFVPTLQEALAGCRWSLGTTRRVRKPRASREDLPALRARWPLPPAQLPLAVVFGPEKDGLTFEDLALCQGTLSIPTSPEHPSLNLAQAVLLVAWELSPLSATPTTPAATTEPATPPPPEAADAAPAAPEASPATHEELEGMYAHFESMLSDIGFVQPETARHQMLALRGLLSRTLPSQREVAQLRGIARQASWAARRPRDDRA